MVLFLEVFLNPAHTFLNKLILTSPEICICTLSSIASGNCLKPHLLPGQLRCSTIEQSSGWFSEATEPSGLNEGCAQRASKKASRTLLPGEVWEADTLEDISVAVL